MVKTKNDPQFEIGANPVSKGGVRKLPIKFPKNRAVAVPHKVKSDP
jgi:hypothetical protein